jgi:hypothetical protein
LAGAPALESLASTASNQTLDQKPESEFGRLAVRLAQQRLGGGEENEKLQEQALGILDSVVLEALNVPGDPNLDALNQRLGALVTQQPPVGEDYHVVRLGGAPPVYGLVANFGLGGPSAVRLYRGVAGRYALAARIDRFTQKDFFDEYLELVPIAAQATLFITVTGRTDELQTGAFTLWRFDGDRTQVIWATDILQQSSYKNRSEGFRLTYCAETDEDNPRVCRRMVRDRYIWDGAAWKRVEQTPLPVPKR